MTNQLHNQSATQLADDYGALDAQIKALTERKDAIKDELKARGIEKAEGDRFTVTATISTRTTYDDKAIREALGADIVRQYERISDTITLRVKATARFAEVA